MQFVSQRQIQNAVVLSVLTSLGNTCQKGTRCTERVTKECQKTLCWDSEMNKTWSSHHLREKPNHTHTHVTTQEYETKCKFWKSNDMTACAAGKYSERFGPIIYWLPSSVKAAGTEMQPDFQFLMLGNYENISSNGVQQYTWTANQQSWFKLDTAAIQFTFAIYPNRYGKKEHCFVSVFKDQLLC